MISENTMQEIAEKAPTEVKRSKQDDLSLKELVLLTREWWTYLFAYWKLLLLVSLLGGGLGLALSFYLPTTYEAKITFVLEEEQSGGLAMGLASQFGLNLGGSGSGGGAFTGDNILQLLQSRNIIEKALLAVVKTPAGKETTLANWYLQSQGWQQKWSEHPKLRDVHFKTGVSRERYTVLQDSALQLLYQRIAGEQLKVSRPDIKLNIIHLIYLERDEHLAKLMAEQILQEATNFYVETKTSKSRSHVQNLQAKADSIEQLLNRKTYTLASIQDMNVNPARRQAAVGIELAGRDKAILQTLYAEVLKNLEMSKMLLVKQTPLFQVIDEPILPLKREKLGRLKALVGGGMLTGLLAIIILVVRRLYQLLMQ